MLISKRSFLNLTRSKIGIIRIWEKRRTEGVEKSASRIIRAACFCSRRMRCRILGSVYSISLFEVAHVYKPRNVGKESMAKFKRQMLNFPALYPRWMKLELLIELLTS
jgi:hypothetical protein